MSEDYSYEDRLEGQKMTKEERYSRIIEYMNTVPDFNYHNGIKLMELRDDFASCKAELTPEAINSQGIAHGGLIFSVCDVAAGFAAANIDRRCVTQAANIYFLRPAQGDYIIATAEPVKNGKTVSVIDAKVFDDQERLVAEAMFSIFYT